MALTRRRLLASGIGTATALGLAGCESDGTSTTTAPKPLELAEVTFCQSQPEGYEDYEPAPDATYGPADVIWVYLEPRGAAIDRSGAAPRVRMTQSVDVVGPHDEVVLSDEQALERELPSPDAADRLYLTSDVALSQPPHAGDHRLSITATDEVAAESVSETRSFTVTGEGTIDHPSTPFELTEITFCGGRPANDGACEPQPGARYAPGATVWLVVDAAGVHYERTTEGVAVRVTGGVSVAGPDGDVVFEDSIDTGVSFASEAAVSTFFLAYPIATQPDTSSGDYATTVDLTDAWGASASRTATFSLD
ncbi:MAG: hypothetical protein V5A43_07820 [Haloarculaceae archaeon]